jgi:uncharacterized protein (TIGR02996 family)
MTDHDALLHAILANPDDDTARLVYADFIQEAGDDRRAEFIRGQVELAKTPDWEPFAVRWRRADLATQAGDGFRESLPWHDSWNPRFPFRRGLGYAVKTNAVQNLIDYGDQLFASAPVGELHLPGGDMQEYTAFAAQPWLPKVRAIRFWTLTTPTEPVRALCASPLATGIDTIHFEKASSPGMSFLVEGLFESPLGQQLRELSFHVGDGSQLDLVEAFEAGGPPRLERLTFDNMGLDDAAGRRLAASPVFDTLRELTFKDMNFDERQVQRLLQSIRPGLQSLSFVGMGFRPSEHDIFAGLSSTKFRSLKRLRITGGYGFRPHLRSILVPPLAGVRALGLRGLSPDDGFFAQLVTAPFWNNLVELDLRDNQLTDQAARYLLAVAPPPELTTLDLRLNDTIGNEQRNQLREHYGHSLLLSEPGESLH